MLGYAAMLREGLRSRGHEVEIVYPPAVFRRLPVGRGEFAKWTGYIDKYLMAPAYLRRKIRSADVVHVCDHSNSMYLACAGQKPTIITCHDLLAINAARGRYPGVSVRLTGRIQQRWIARGLARARYVVCVSHKTASDFHETFPATAAPVRVIHNALNRPFKAPAAHDIEAALRDLSLPPATRYLLHVGGNTWYKNRPAAMQIFAELKQYPEFREVVLVMAGDAWTRRLRELARSERIRNAVIEAKNMSDTALTALYHGAEALLFPSLEEGFGWPILEAQACGCPVITTVRAPMTEVAGEAAILVDPAEPERAAQVIREQWHRRPVLRDLGYRNLQRFSSEATFDAYCEAYREAVSLAR